MSVRKSSAMTTSFSNVLARSAAQSNGLHGGHSKEACGTVQRSFENTECQSFQYNTTLILRSIGFTSATSLSISHYCKGYFETNLGISFGNELCLPACTLSRLSSSTITVKVSFLSRYRIPPPLAHSFYFL